MAKKRKSNKSKIENAFHDSGSMNHRRSSLRVNLSYGSDSGNESLKKSHVGNESMSDRSFGEKIIANRTRSKNVKNKSTNISIDQSKHGLLHKSSLITQVRSKTNIKLMNVTVKLTDISKKEQALHQNCDKLKDAILRKTREIFDNKNEFTIKTSNILENKSDSSVNTVHHTDITKVSSIENHIQACGIVVKDTIPTITFDTGVLNKPESATYISDKVVCMSKRKKEDDQSIIPTPKSKRCDVDNGCKQRASKKRLFTNKDNDKQTSLYDNNEQSLSMKEASVVDSPILSGSNKRFNKPSHKSSDKLKNIKDKSIIHTSQSQKLVLSLSNASTLTLLEDQLAAVGAPIMCSTFNEEHTQSKQHFLNNSNDEKAGNKNLEINSTVFNNIEQSQIKNTQLSIDNTTSADTSSCSETNNDVASRISSNSQNHEAVQKGDSNCLLNQMESKRINQKTSCSNKELMESNGTNRNNSHDRNMEVITVNNISTTELRKIQDASYLRSCNFIGLHKNNKRNSGQHNSDQDISTRTIQLSLNVNTSLDKLEDSNKGCDKNQESTGCMQSKENEEDVHCTKNKGTKPTADFEEQESINTVRTSLQVNTSLDSILKSQMREDTNGGQRLTEGVLNHRNTNLSATQDYANVNIINLKQQLKTSPTRKQVHCKLIPRECNGVNYVEQTMENRNKSKQCDAHDTEGNSGLSSRMESTPHSINDPVISACNKQNNAMTSLKKEINLEHSIPTANCTIHGTLQCNERYTLRGRLRKRQSNVAVRQTGKTCKTLEEVLQETIVLDDTPVVQVNSAGEHSPIIINDTLYDNNSIENITNTNFLEQSKIVTKARGKRKLLPLHEMSQLLSLTPLEDQSVSPKQTTFNKRRRKKKLNVPKQKSLPGKVKSILKDKREDLPGPNRALRSNKVLECSESQGEKQKKQRKVISKKIIIKNFINADIIKHLEKYKNPSSEERHEVNKPGSSLNEFQMEKIISTNKFNRSRKIVIVTTGLSKGDKNLVKRIVTTIGMARLEPTVTRHTTHVVCTGVRTINLLHGIIRGCWLVTIEWVLRSLEHNKWLDPEEYEMKHFSKAMLENRKDRQLFGAFYVPELFSACGLIYVENATTPPANSLKDLIKAAGGQITEDLRNAKVIIGTEGVKESWIIDSITTGEVQPFDQYKRR